jgi:hypothetical protein
MLQPIPNIEKTQVGKIALLAEPRVGLAFGVYLFLIPPWLLTA